ncbi:hypothetical protein HMPREF9696_00264 [Afipia clevelandensis ATCC 49720]|uniref:DUF2147 domain-containing protein n=2 Tax=Afipia clevelandensis TaxID=1034 RepID=K8PMA5_9BRAD|nr:DUF2147 domain-containing protein [Afipia clevelandensis]EKS42721.1 hypothetical protein HMPREF9696_00264 [Afipia clevelandensis ATCC 49720]
MRKIALSGMFLLAAAGAASAAEPLGEWKVEEDKATIRIVDCNSRLWGVIASEKIPGNIDSKNPDKAKRTRLTLGIPVLLNMKKAEDEKDKWEGQIYDATSGKTYDANIQLKSPNSLRVEGCVAMILCGGQTWTRVTDNASPAAQGQKAPAAKGGAAPFPTPIGAPKTAAPKAGAKAGTPDAAHADICLIPEIANAPR